MPSSFHHLQTVADTVAPLDHIKRNGYYIVGDKIFAHKVAALREATSTRQPVRFYFYDDVFRQVDWQQRSDVTLLELYRLRAQQLRDKYDYIICNFSGGADSTTVIESFVNNNIRLDEVLVSWPLKYLDKKFPVSLDRNATNLVSEWELSIKPKLSWLQREHPEVKITIADYSEDLGTDEDNEDSLIYTAKCGYVAIKKHRAKDRVIAERQQKYKNVVAIAGINPVACRMLDQYLAIYFQDEVCNGYRSDYLPGGYIRTVEFFYWSGDLPEIVKTQAHILLDHLKQNPSDLAIIDTMTMQSNTNFRLSLGSGEHYRDLGRRLFYPNWDHLTFQANKPEIWIGPCEWYDWYYSNAHAQSSLESWQSMIDNQLASISPQYLKTKGTDRIGFNGIETKNYVIGKIRVC